MTRERELFWCGDKNTLYKTPSINASKHIWHCTSCYLWPSHKRTKFFWLGCGKSPCFKQVQPNSLTSSGTLRSSRQLGLNPSHFAQTSPWWFTQSLYQLTVNTIHDRISLPTGFGIALEYNPPPQPTITLRLRKLGDQIPKMRVPRKAKIIRLGKRVFTVVSFPDEPNLNISERMTRERANTWRTKGIQELGTKIFKGRR